ncbi:MAG: hypothetical protein PHZ24_08995 [Bacteroidales bacterium]|nr:hypothetical protein [Bacteroidales bacterium]
MKYTNYILFAFGFLLLLTIVGCRTQQPTIITEVQEKIVERLVPYALPSDSSEMQLRITCDSLNNVLISELSEYKTKGINSKLTVNNDRLVYKTVVNRDTVFIPVTDTFTSFVHIEIPGKTVKENNLTKLQLAQIWLARWYILIVLVGAVVFLIQIRKLWKIM